MAITIDSAYGNYMEEYLSGAGRRKTGKETVKTTGKEAHLEKTDHNDEERRTATEEFSYLSNKYEGITFAAMNYKQGMRYGSNATTNIAISPEFLKKMADDPALEKEYEDQFENMKKIDEQNIKTHEAQGRRLIAQGWVIDKNGGMSKWSISEATDKRHYGQEMTEYFEKLQKKRIEKKKEHEEADVKRDSNVAGRAVKSDTVEISDAARQMYDLQKNSDIIKISGNSDLKEDNEPSDKDDESNSDKRMIGINASKLARRLAAAKTKSQVQSVIAAIKSDLKECESGKAQGADVYEESVAAAEQLLQKAEQRLSEVEDREPTPEEEMESSLAGLF